MYVYSISVTAQMPAMHPEHVLPPYTGPISPVYTPIKTSAYSHSDVNFDISGVGHLALQDLYVYTWNDANFVNAGIAWIRRDPATDNIIDEGYINVPTSTHNISIQHAGLDNNAFVQYNIIDLLGREISRKHNIVLNQLEATVNKDLTILGAGIYHLKVQSPSSIHTFTLTKL